MLPQRKAAVVKSISAKKKAVFTFTGYSLADKCRMGSWLLQVADKMERNTLPQPSSEFVHSVTVESWLEIIVIIIIIALVFALLIRSSKKLSGKRKL